jgi:cysteinyl-tRNA synthetase
MRDINLFNTLSRKKEKFVPLNKDNITLYACGPTVYNDPHVGNARSLVVFDLLFRVLQEKYGNKKVTYVRNITDIDDKIIEISKKTGKPIKQVTADVTKVFHGNCKDLNCLPPTKEPKATEHIKGMIAMTESLIKKGHAYVTDAHVYFKVNSFNAYGQLSNKKITELQAGSRVEVSKLKKDPLDFVLWKPSTADEPKWQSPWGEGRPGWHLECSVMSEKFLGPHFDIHGGGLDLIFPHHENEIAQSCANSGNKNFANYWVHNGFLTMKNDKMSKSVGNIVTINDVLKSHNGQTIRLALLSAHYKQPLDWSTELLEQSKKNLDKWYKFYSEKTSAKISDENLKILFDDLNTPALISKIHEIYNRISGGDNDLVPELNSLIRLLGLFNQSKAEWEKSKQEKISISEKEINELIDERNKARKEKNYQLSDQIRDRLIEHGIVIEDVDSKTIWKYK